MVFKTYFKHISTSIIVKMSVFKNFQRILIIIGIYDFERNPKSSFRPKFWPQKFFWSASWKIFVLEFLKGRFQIAKKLKIQVFAKFSFFSSFSGSKFRFDQDRLLLVEIRIVCIGKIVRFGSKDRLPSPLRIACFRRDSPLSTGPQM